MNQSSSPWLTVASIEQRAARPELTAEAIGGFLQLELSEPTDARLAVRCGTRLIHRDEAGAGKRHIMLPGLLLDPTFDLRVSMRPGERGQREPLARISGTVDFSALAVPTGRQPILVRAPGRAGTTYFMRLLLDHAEIALVDEYPYELRHAAALYQQLLGTSSAVSDSSGHGELDSVEVLPNTGPNPFFAPSHSFFDFIASEQFAQRVGQTQALVSSFYDEVDRRSGRPSKRFAEKFVPMYLAPVLHHLYVDARSVQLMRDPRDIALSQLAFNERRGFEGFGLDTSTFTDRVTLVARSQLKQLGAARSDPEGVIVLRYESLMRDTPGVLTELLDWLPLDSSPAMIEAMVEAGASDGGLRHRHMTSTSQADSIHRWRTELPDESLDAVAEACDDMIVELGYSPSR